MDKVIIFINSHKYYVDSSYNLLQICLSLNIDVPYFCWHPALGSVGSCRLCAVKQYSTFYDNTGRIIMSCMSSVSDNMIISTIDREVQKNQKGIIELLMTNHPHDCPVCEEGGSCHLQDMTVMVKHNIRRYMFPKRTHRNQYLGSFISHQMNRCISCYRCVRYYRDYADGTDFGVYGTSNNVYFGRFKDGTLESEYSGNLVEVCPTGVFTDKIYSQNYNRKWDLQYSPSICQHCCVGCNIIIGERYGKLNKVENRYHHSINRYFLCDLGRFGYNYVNVKKRYKQPFINIINDKKFLKKKDTIKLISNILCNSTCTIGIGSIRSSIENNFSLRKLVGKDNFSSGMLDMDHNCVKLIIDVLENSGIYVPTLPEIEKYDLILIIGEDITQTASMIALSVRQAAKRNNCNNNVNYKNIPKWHSAAMLNISYNNKKCVYILHTHETKLDDIAALNYYGSIQEQEIFAFSIENRICNMKKNLNCLNSSCNNEIDIVVNALMLCKKPLIISGSHSGSMNLIQSSVNIAKGLKNLYKDVGLVLLTPAVNSIGVGILSHMSLENVLDKCDNNMVDTLIILENNLYRHISEEVLNPILKKVNNIIVLDHQIHKIINKSTIFLPLSNFSESSGTVINYEGRAQRFFSSFNPVWYDHKSCILEGWKWLYKIYFQSNKIQKFSHIQFDTVIQEYTQNIHIFKNIKNIAPDANFRIYGQKIARLPHRASSRTAVNIHKNIHEPMQKIDYDTMFSFSMEGNQNSVKYSQYVPFIWSPGWNSSQLWNKYEFSKLNFDSGVRLFPLKNSNVSYTFKPKYHDMSIIIKKQWCVIPYYLLLGSEEMSYQSLEIKEKFYKIYALISLYHKKELDKKVRIEFYYLGKIFQFFIKFSSKLTSYNIGLPVGIPGIPRSLIGYKIKNIRGII
ncbi:NADH-quinone oxidoreductase subunit NuoG [Buchnera aphidicola]|uniref:NADH-quinone oxidoreductase n=1 Tax=Buchnera aphidicola (Stegophylla sp.) TaxID=2315800 RepID=A0A4D6Y8M6_9GAMM|nr:NADH-quinone oxidoreductase subunit NuoG [Buchnera aphidicola (Stegophylla sp.)]QCI26296.1 NADH-quinone oxidoreductase subunit NuoG [Buchnera aphidicola (Stegophylla sp.)]